MKTYNKHIYLPPHPTTQKGGLPSCPPACGRVLSPPVRRFLFELLSGVAMAALILAFIWMVVQDIGDGRIKAGPLPVSDRPIQEVIQRMEYHGTLAAYRCNRPSGWCFKRQGKEVELW